LTITENYPKSTTAFPVISINSSRAVSFLPSLIESFFLKLAVLSEVLRLEGGGGGVCEGVWLPGCYYFFIDEFTCFCFIAALLN
jgi:hypothetical protein